MTYRVHPKQPEKRAADLPWEQAAPGLYEDGEVLVALDDIHATVSVETKWLENGAGVTFFGTARWCDEKGETHLCPAGEHVESQISMTVDPVTLDRHGLESLKKEVLLVLMGEEPSLTHHDGENEVPVIQLNPTVKLNASIRHAAKTVTALKSSSNPMELLK